MTVELCHKTARQKERLLQVKSTTPHKWIFTSRLRARAFGWSSSPLACQRIKEAVAEIQLVARQDPLRAAEGAIVFMERLWPALEQVDSSSGALGSAASRGVATLIDLILAAPADAKTRAKWLDRLWEAFQNDGIGYVDGLGERWGELCDSAAVASQRADTLLPVLLGGWEERAKTGAHVYFNGTEACFSCLLAAERYQETLDVLELAPYLMWSYRRYGVRALVALNRVDEAITYALDSRGLNDNQAAIDRVCEDILLKQGRSDEAYQRFALTANLATTNLATFRAIKKKYPGKEPQTILQGLIAHNPGEEGKWFATAKELGLYDLAIELVSNSPADPRTLNRAARDFAIKNPSFALGAALASLRWIVAGYGYEITGADVSEAYRAALQIAAGLGAKEQVQEEIQRILQAETSWAAFARQVLGIRADR